MNRIASALFTAALSITTLGPASAAPYGQRLVELGGVNLNTYCRAVFGQGFKSVLIGSTAGDWTCERSAGNRRPISVQQACNMQYSGRGIVAKALDWNDPGSWRCFKAGYSRPTGRILGGLDLTGYCRATFGQGFKAVTLGSGAGDWTCERSAGDRRPISVQKACEMQYQARPIKAVALDANDAGSWRCKG